MPAELHVKNYFNERFLMQLKIANKSCKGKNSHRGHAHANELICLIVHFYIKTDNGPFGPKHVDC
jgi:hypothetical protein